MNLTQAHNEIMEKHELRLNEIKSLKTRGDWDEVAEKTGLVKNTAQMAFIRVGSRNHLKVVKALEEVIAARLSKFKTA